MALQFSAEAIGGDGPLIKWISRGNVHIEIIPIEILGKSAVLFVRGPVHQAKEL